MRQVFISYSSKEAKQANEIVAVLEKQGVRCWIAPRDIGIGSNYMRAIPAGIKECPFYLLVLSRNRFSPIPGQIRLKVFRRTFQYPDPMV